VSIDECSGIATSKIEADVAVGRFQFRAIEIRERADLTTGTGNAEAIGSESGHN
jgi:hypothetical protein